MIIKKYSVHIAWFIALCGTFGSLYFSEILKYIPCEMCWYQRIAMYPMLILLSTILLCKEHKFAKHLLPLSLIGIGLSSFHYSQQKIESVGETFQCGLGIPCSGEYINWFGFITISFLSLVAFVLISVMLYINHKSN